MITQDERCIPLAPPHTIRIRSSPLRHHTHPVILPLRILIRLERHLATDLSIRVHMENAIAALSHVNQPILAQLNQRLCKVDADIALLSNDTLE